MFFVFKKICTAILLPPGIFMFLSAIFSFAVRGRSRILFLSLAAFIYVFSIPFVSSRLVSAAEYRADTGVYSTCDVIVLLGGGVVEGVNDLSGRDALSPESVLRTCDAARLWRMIRKPVIVCGGSVNGSPTESLIAARYLRDLGVSASDIIVEDRSQDTAENAEFASAIIKDKGFTLPVVVTSSLHCRRAEKEFRIRGISPRMFPSGKSGISRTGIGSFLPSAFALRESFLSIKEPAGMFFQSGIFVLRIPSE